jgi:hypothetical protein
LQVTNLISEFDEVKVTPLTVNQQKPPAIAAGIEVPRKGTVIDSIVQTIDESQSKKKKTKAKKKKGKKDNVPMTDDVDEDEEEKLILQAIEDAKESRKQLEKQNKKNKKKETQKDNKKGPKYLSSKDPTLDNDQKLFLKFGKGKNLVATGPTKIRDNNWLHQNIDENAIVVKSDEIIETLPTTMDTNNSNSHSIETLQQQQQVEQESSNNITYHYNAFTFSFPGL